MTFSTIRVEKQSIVVPFLLLFLYTNAQTNFTGPVGIGTTNPSSTLDVVGTAKINGTTTINGSTTSQILLNLKNTINSTANPTLTITGYGNGNYSGNTQQRIGEIDFYNNSPTNLGSAGRIIVAFGDNTNGSGQMRFQTSPGLGTPVDRMTIDKNGNVGIGISSPDKKLHVNGTALFSGSTNLGTSSIGTSDSYGFLFTDRGTSWTEMAVHSQTTGAMLYANPQTSSYSGKWGTLFPSQSAGLISNPSTSLVFGAGKEAMRFLADGKVGIGTTSPSYGLHIKSSSAGVINTVASFWNASSSAGSGARVLLQTSAGDNQYGAAIASVNEASSPSYQNAALIFQTMNNVAEFTNLQERMRITSAGNVGIGTSNPTYKLDVSIPSSQITTNANILRIHRALGTNGAGALFDIALNNSAGAVTNFVEFSGGIVSNTAGSEKGRLSLRTIQNGSMTDVMYFNEDGNVGIGTTKPGTMKLAVEGTIGARKVRVTQVVPWPDYVFKQGYKLPSLTDLESYIKAYNHLPDVPSANDVEKEGIDLGSTQAALLKKIEELTLYVIELKKEIDLIKTGIK